MADNKEYITKGPLLKSIIRFSIPVMIATIVQNLFHSADMIILGNMEDSIAVASVGATGNIISLVITGFIALSFGTSVFLAYAIGAKDEERIKKIVDTSIYFALACGVFVAIVGNIVSVPLLRALDCPADCFDGAVIYLRIYMCGAPAILVYNFGAAIIRAEGDSRRPLIHVIVSGIVNVVLNIILCIVMTEKVAAVAISTVVSQVIGAFLVIWRLTHKDGNCRFTFKKPSFSFPDLSRMLRFAIPSALTNMMYPIATLQITSTINSYGSECVAGGSAATNIELITSSLYGAFAVALITFMSQNIGAANRKRVEKTIVYCAILSVAIASLGPIIYFFCGEEVLSLYVPGDELAIFYGMKRLKYVLAFQMISALNGIFGSAIQAFGHPFLSTIESVITVLVFRIIWMNFIYPRYETIDALLFCFTCSWILHLILVSITFAFAFSRYRRNSILQEKGRIACGSSA